MTGRRSARSRTPGLAESRLTSRAPPRSPGREGVPACVTCEPNYSTLVSGRSRADSFLASSAVAAVGIRPLGVVAVPYIVEDFDRHYEIVIVGVLTRVHWSPPTDSRAFGVGASHRNSRGDKGIDATSLRRRITAAANPSGRRVGPATAGHFAGAAPYGGERTAFAQVSRPSAARALSRSGARAWPGCRAPCGPPGRGLARLRPARPWRDAGPVVGARPAVPSSRRSPAVSGVR